eukprot:3203865-Pyramimonas_sp.AAC.1
MRRGAREGGSPQEDLTFRRRYIAKNKSSPARASEQNLALPMESPSILKSSSVTFVRPMAV